MISNGIERGLHMKLIDEYFETAMEAWDMMQKTSGDEGAEWAERFERYFYEFIDELKKWWKTLQPKPTNDRGGRGVTGDTKVDGANSCTPATQFSYRIRGYIGWD